MPRSHHEILRGTADRRMPLSRGAPVHDELVCFKEVLRFSCLELAAFGGNDAADI